MSYVRDNMYLGDHSERIPALITPMYLGDRMFWDAASGDAILIFRGEGSPENINYARPIASRFGTGDVTIPSPPHEKLVNYYYAARQVSIFGKTEENMTCNCLFRRGEDGEADYERPDHVSDLRATAAAGGTVDLFWTHKTIDGTKPVQFNIYYDEGLGIERLREIVEYRNDTDAVLIISGDGDDGSQDITDESDSEHTVTVGGSAAISTAQKKFGSASILFSGATDKLTIANSADFNFGDDDFTIDFWFRMESNTNHSFYYHYQDANHYNQIIGNYSYVQFQVKSNTGSFSLTGFQDFELHQWHHVAVVRSGSTFYLFIDGVLKDSETYLMGFTLSTFTANPEINNGGGFRGYIDEFHISLAGLWTEDFTPPRAPWVFALGTETYRGDGQYTFRTAALTHGQPCNFCVQAEDANGNQDKFLLSVLATPDSVGPAAIDSLTVTTRL